MVEIKTIVNLGIEYEKIMKEKQENLQHIRIIKAKHGLKTIRKLLINIIKNYLF